MEKQTVIKKIEHEWNTFARLAESFAEKDCVRPGAIGYWNVHEALLHIAAWDNAKMIAVKKFEETGEKPEWIGWSGDAIDQLNEQLISERRNLDSVLIWEHFQEAHTAFVEFLSTCDEPVFSGGSFAGDRINYSAQHYQVHTQDLTRFKESLQDEAIRSPGIRSGADG